jgi:hypothetical protein
MEDDENEKRTPWKMTSKHKTGFSQQPLGGTKTNLKLKTKPKQHR